MTFSLSIFLYIYIAFLAVWLLLSFTGIYHMFKFGFKNYTTPIVTFIFVVVSLLLLYASYYYISMIDWNINISFFEGIFNRTMEY